MTDQTQQQQHEVWIPLDVMYNPGECRISKQITGPRGGKSWKALTFGLAATGGLKQMWLTPGLYKRNAWTCGNPVPRKSMFRVYEDGSWAWIEE